MTFKLSPGVYSFEEDRSQVITSEQQEIVTTVGAFKKGPLKPTRITNRSELYSKYTTGKIDRKFGYSAMCCYSALENVKNLVIKRVVNNAKYSGLSVIKNGLTETQSVAFLTGSSNDYESGGKEIKAISISGPLPFGYGLSVTMKNTLTNESTNIESTFSQDASSNDILSSFAKLIQNQLNSWGENGKAVKKQVWSGSPKQEIHKIKISRSMVAGESIKLTIEDFMLGSKEVNVSFDSTMEATLEALRVAVNATKLVFAYIDSTDENSLIVTALNAGPNRIVMTAEFVDIAEEPLSLEDKITQAGHGVYDDTTIALCDPDNTPIEYSSLEVVQLPIDDVTIYSLVSEAIVKEEILASDRQAVTNEINSKKPVYSIQQCNTIITDWANANPYLKSIVVHKQGEINPVVELKVGDTVEVEATLSNGNTANDNLTYQWSDTDNTKDFGTSQTLELTSTMVGYRLKCEVEGYRNNLEFVSSNVVEEA